jgi:hypothetical protein
MIDGDLMRRFEALDDEVPMTDEEAKSILEEAGVTRADLDSGLARCMEMIRTARGNDAGMGSPSAPATAAPSGKEKAPVAEGLSPKGATQI